MAHFAAVQQVEQEPFVGGASLEYHRQLSERPTQTNPRFVTIAAPGHDLRQRRILARPHRVALGHPRIDAQTRAGRHLQQHHPTWGRSEANFGIFGFEAHGDGVAVGHGRCTHQATTLSDVQLQLGKIDPGRGFRDTVTQRQATTDTQQRHIRGWAFADERDRRRPDDSQHGGNTRGNRPQEVAIHADQGRVGRLHEHLLRTALQGAVVHAERPHRPELVADHQHFDVPCVAAVHDPQRRQPSTRRLGGLLEQRPIGDVRQGHRAQPDVGDAQSSAEIRERRLLRQGTPTHPRRVHPGKPERIGERVDAVDIRWTRYQHALIGLAHEQGTTFGFRVDGDDSDFPSVLGRVLPGGVDQSHGGSSLVDDRQSSDARHRVHVPLRCSAKTGGGACVIADRKGASNRSSGPPGTMVVA